jgi:hypothetical protein
LNGIGSSPTKFLVLLQNSRNLVRISPLDKYRKSDTVLNRLIGSLPEMGEWAASGQPGNFSREIKPR